MKIEDIQEWHTTDLTDSCPARVKLRLTGNINSRAPTAMVRGMLAGGALEYLHEKDPSDWGTDHAPISEAIKYGACLLRESLETDNRILTDAAEDALVKQLPSELELVLGNYARRLGPIFAKTAPIGTEVPIRASFEGVKFASHLDLVFHDPDDVFATGTESGLVVFDWKWRMDSPAKAYLARNKQFLLYWLACKYGSLLVSGAGMKDWVNMDQYPGMAWVHLPALKPYTRKVTTKDDDGFVQEFKKGDDRPLRQIVRVVKYQPAQAEAAIAAVVRKVEMFKAGFWPQNPDPVGCGICEAEEFCTRFDTVALEGDA